MMKETIKDRFEKANVGRQAVLERSRQYAELTIPAILPPEGFTEEQELTVPYQSLGARGVNNLTSSIMSAIMPPGSHFFKFQFDHETIPADREPPTQWTEQLLRQERKVHERIWSSNIRVGVDTALQHAAITGNSLIYLTDSMTLRVYRLDEYIVRRSPDGRPFEIITKDYVDVLTLPQSVIEEAGIQAAEADIDKDPRKRYIPVYTQAWYNGEKWEVTQEVEEVKFGAPKTFKHSRHIPIRWRALAGENYGRGHIEDYIGDLRSYEGLQKAILEAAAIMSRVIPLVDPTSPYTNADELNKAENGEFVAGREEDVFMWESNKARDLMAAFQQAQNIEQRLGFAFLLNSAVQPTGERVTATQIRTLVRELEGVLGGIFSMLAQELQEPLLNAIIEMMESNKEIAPIKDNVEIVLIAGLEALGREQDLVRIQTFAQSLGLLGEEGLRYLNKEEFIRKMAIASNINPEGLIRSQQEVMQEMAQQQAIASAGGIAENAARNVNGQQQ